MESLRLVDCFILWNDISILLYFIIKFSIFDLSKLLRNKLACNILIHSFSSTNLSVIAEIIASSISRYLISLFCWFVCFLFKTSQKDWILVVLSSCFTCTVFSTDSNIYRHLLLSFILDSYSFFNVFNLVESLINFTSKSKYLFLRISKSCLTTSFIFAYISFL